MIAMVARRIRNSVILLVLASMLCFGLVVSAPGNLAVLIAELRSPSATFEDIRAIEEELGLNNSLPVRYADWLGDALKGDFGISYMTGDEVGHAVSSRLSTTGILIAGGSLFGLVLSITLGVAGTLRPHGWIDTLTRSLALLGASTPAFFVGAILMYIFSVQLQWLPTFGSNGFKGWIMPWITIGLVPSAVLSRVVRVGLEDALSRPFSITAASKGLSRNTIVFRDALPVIAPTYINAWGTQTAALTIGAVVVEPLFALQGIGALFLQGVLLRDYMVVQAGLLIFTTFFIVLNMLVDIAVMMADPKLRRQAGHS
jgi:peptide/nickel transport system permease protein